MNTERLRQAQAVIPLLIAWIRPKSVVDIGCGAGEWLKAFAQNGVADTLGVDAAPRTLDTLCIPPTRFVAADLERALCLGRSFDLALSLGTLERVRAPYRNVFLDSLTGLSAFIVFSGNAPLEGFRKRGFAAVDCLRGRLDDAVIFARADLLKTKPLLLDAWKNVAGKP